MRIIQRPLWAVIAFMKHHEAHFRGDGIIETSKRDLEPP